jgi:hypothetical protein
MSECFFDASALNDWHLNRFYFSKAACRIIVKNTIPNPSPSPESNSLSGPEVCRYMYFNLPQYFQAFLSAVKLQ